MITGGNLTLSLTLQFVATVEGTIFEELLAVVSVIITAVIPAGPVQVNNTIAFTSSDYTAAVAGQAGVAAVLSTAASSVFPDTSFGTITFSAVTTGNATNPSRCPKPSSQEPVSQGLCSCWGQLAHSSGLQSFVRKRNRRKCSACQHRVVQFATALC